MNKMRRRLAVRWVRAVGPVVPIALFVLHGDQVSVLTGSLPHLAAVILAAGLGAWVRAHRHPVIPASAGPGGVAAAT